MVQLRGLGAGLLAVGAGVVLPACATQRDTAQALTIAGAAAVVIGASMAADEQCYSAGPGEGGVQSYCSPGLSKGARTAGKGLAVAGVGLAAAGYALRPKGPDRTQRPPSDPDEPPSSPYRLIRRAPAPPDARPAASSGEAAPSEEAPPCRPSGSHSPAEAARCPSLSAPAPAGDTAAPFEPTPATPEPGVPESGSPGGSTPLRRSLRSRAAASPARR